MLQVSSKSYKILSYNLELTFLHAELPSSISCYILYIKLNKYIYNFYSIVFAVMQTQVTDQGLHILSVLVIGGSAWTDSHLWSWKIKLK